LVLAGHRVFAGCLTESGEQTLRRNIADRFKQSLTPSSSTPTLRPGDDIKSAMDRLVPFRLDVTNVEQIKAAFTVLQTLHHRPSLRCTTTKLTNSVKQ
jgi:hypothetical protein